MLNAPRGCLSFPIKFLGRTVYTAHRPPPYARAFLEPLPCGICPHHSARRLLSACPGHRQPSTRLSLRLRSGAALDTVDHWPWRAQSEGPSSNVVSGHCPLVSGRQTAPFTVAAPPGPIPSPGLSFPCLSPTLSSSCELSPGAA